MLLAPKPAFGSLVGVIGCCIACGQTSTRGAGAATTANDDVSSTGAGGVLPGPLSQRTLSAGGSHTCAIAVEGSAACWGRNNQGQAAVPELACFVDIAAGNLHSCGVCGDERLRCWGSDRNAVTPPPAGSFLAVVANSRHSCALNVAGKATCWGSSGPWLDAPDRAFVQLAVGAAHSCGRAKGGAVVCWGENDVGQLLSATDAEWVATGGRTTCILSSGGELVCEGEFSTEDAGAAIVLPPQANLLDVSIGSAHVCVLTSNEEVKCWQGGFAEDAVGQAEAPEGRFIAISAGGNHTCAVAPDGNITCWGSDADGQASPPNGLKVRL